MRILVISDIHANANALEAVLEAATDYTDVWCLGDLVGYGPDPNRVIDMVRDLPNLQCIIGNHDAAAVKMLNLDTFNTEAKLVIQWTQNQLTPENHQYLVDLPEKTELEYVTLAHGSPRSPIWEYILDTRTATENFEDFYTPYCFVGHSHVPVIFYLGDEQIMANMILPDEFTRVTLTPRAILNPGSVGQPRDRDPRASFGIFDADEHVWEYHRVEYDINGVQERMRQANLPKRHIDRLNIGW